MNQLEENNSNLRMEQEIETPIREIDGPSERVREPYYDRLTPMQQKEWHRWLKNMGFMKTILIIMFLDYIIDVLIGKGQSDLKEPFFEVLKTILFTVSGYLFAKKQDE